MKKVVMVGMVVMLMASASALRAQDASQLPAPQKEHEWLQQLAGEWETEGEAILEPGKPPLKCKGTESARTLGGFWILSEIRGGFMNMPMTGMMTVGYDPQKKKYVGTWVDSMTHYLWRYEGALDASGKVLTLEAEGPDHSSPGRLCKYRDVVEVKSKDHKVLTSSMQLEDGKWVTFMTMHARRKK